MVLEKARQIRVEDNIRRGRKVNLDWILSNRQELLDNYPNKWAAIKDESVQLVDDEIFALHKVMESRGDAEEVIYYLCNSYSPPAVFVRPIEVILDESENI